jgi:hypothetical protein
MRTAEDIIFDEEKNLDHPSDGWETTYTYRDVIKLINIAREEAIKECAERAKIIWIDDDYNEELRDMNRHAEIDKSSILNIIKELK